MPMRKSVPCVAKGVLRDVAVVYQVLYLDELSSRLDKVLSWANCRIWLQVVTSSILRVRMSQ